jgi:hypothetical protein
LIKRWLEKQKCMLELVRPEKLRIIEKLRETTQKARDAMLQHQARSAGTT